VTKLGRDRRLFAGIVLDDVARSACASVARRLRATGFAAAYEDPQKFHMTLAFLGNVPPGRVLAIESAIAEAARREPFAIRFDRLGAFPHVRRPRVVFVGASEQGAAFRDLAGSLRASLTREGFSFVDDPVAHVTIARVKSPVRPLPIVDVVPAATTVHAVALFESLFDQENGTSRYEVPFQCALSIGSASGQR
jgi:2'-5' RNA ligase